MNSTKRDLLGLLGVVAIFCVSLCLLPINGFLGVAVLLVTIAIGIAIVTKKKNAAPKKSHRATSKKVSIDSEYDGWLNEEHAVEILREIDGSLDASDLIDAMTEAAKERRLAGKATSDDYIQAIDAVAQEYDRRVRIMGDGFEIEVNDKDE